MLNVHLLAVGLGLITVACAAESKTSTLVVANVIFRHGDRAAINSFPNDKYNESFWPYGYGELTDIGKQQHYKLGQLLRKRYDKLLLDKFYYQNIEVISSDVNRCLVSAYSDLAGLYANQTEKEDLQLPFMRWQPVPVHTQPVQTDELLAMHRPCKLAEQSINEAFNSPNVQQINEDYEEMFQLISYETGLNLSVNGLRNVFMVQDTLLCESIHGVPLPDWTQGNVTCNGNSDIPCDGKTVWEVLTEMKGYQFYVMYNSSIVHRFEGGPLLVDINEKFHAFVSGNRTIAFNMYSGHDSTVAATLSALGVPDESSPEYASAILVELHDYKGEYHVRFYRKNETDSDDIHPLEIPGCSSKCSLANFTELLKPYAIEDWDTACHNTADASTTTHGPPKTTTGKATTTHGPPKTTTGKADDGISVGTVIAISVTAAVLIILLSVGLICVLKRRPNQYQPVE